MKLQFAKVFSSLWEICKWNLPFILALLRLIFICSYASISSLFYFIIMSRIDLCSSSPILYRFTYFPLSGQEISSTFLTCLLHLVRFTYICISLSLTLFLSLPTKGNYLSALVSLRPWLSQSINNLFLPNSPRLGIRRAKALLCHLVLRFTLWSQTGLRSFVLSLSLSLTLWVLDHILNWAKNYKIML